MTRVTAYGTLLAASSDSRELSYLLLPFGEPGHTSAGLVTASAGTVQLPADPGALVGNLEHEPTRPVSRATSVEETDAGIVCTVRVLPTQAGEDLLVEASEGVRDGISVELDDTVIRAGQLVSGTLTAYGHVTRPAFPSARLAAAEDLGELEDPEVEGGAAEDLTTALTDLDQLLQVDSSPLDPAVVEELATAIADALATIAPPDPSATPDPANPTPQEPAVSTARATVIPGTPAAAAARASRPAAARDVFASLAAAFKSGGARALTAALADITPASTPGMEVPAYVGELWSGKAYERRYVPLFNHADLTSYEVKGWRWLTKPAVGAYAGAPAQPTSNAFSTEQVTISAERIAGAHGIDRKHRDFGDEEFYRAYFAAMTESYARVSDVTVLGDVVAAATPIVVGAVPAGVSRTMAMVVDGILKVLEGTDTFPTFAVVASGLWRDVALTREQDRLAFLDAAIGLDEGTLAERNFRLIPSASLAAGKVFTAATDAVTVHELGGGSPIRVEAEAISKGEIEEGVFGYYAVNVHDEDGLVVVDDGV